MNEELVSILCGRVAVVGVGDSGRGDDGAGPRVAALLEEAGVEHVIDSGRWPELDTWKLREIAPDTVLFVDAVDLGARAGDAALLTAQELRSAGFDTHKAPLRLTMEYVQAELGCRTCLLAVQPQCVREGAGMSEDVEQSVRALARILIERLSDYRHFERIENAVRNLPLSSFRT